MARAVPCKCMYKYKAGERHSKSPATSQNHSMFVLTKHNKSELAYCACRIKHSCLTTTCVRWTHMKKTTVNNSLVANTDVSILTEVAPRQLWYSPTVCRRHLPPTSQILFHQHNHSSHNHRNSHLQSKWSPMYHSGRSQGSLHMVHLHPPASGYRCPQRLCHQLVQAN